MFRKLLVGLNGSETSWQAFRRALALAAEQGGELWAISVEEHLPHFPATVGELEDKEERENASFTRIQGQAQELAEERNVCLYCRTVPGSAAERIVAFARQGGFDLIVVGHRGHTNP